MASTLVSSRLKPAPSKIPTIKRPTPQSNSNPTTNILATPNLPTVTPKVATSISTPAVPHISKLAHTQGIEERKKLAIKEKENHPNPPLVPSITPALKKSTPYIASNNLITPVSTIIPKVSSSFTPSVSNPTPIINTNASTFVPSTIADTTKSKEVKGYTELKKSEELLSSENKRISNQLRSLELERDTAIQQLLSLQNEVSLLKESHSKVLKQQEEERDQFQQRMAEQEQESVGKIQKEMQDLREEVDGYRSQITALERKLEECGVDVVSLQRVEFANAKKQEEIRNQFHLNLSSIHQITENIESRLNQDNLLQEKWAELENNFALWSTNCESLMGEVLDDFENESIESQNFDELLLLQEV
eukprot:TRINITY_DN3152_c0_g2_i1.p1 TRINITY_DN3152_c0_g2~~TRINITY_DN3152_c0_g2_i1.p1  ORF type:complete len:362 (-),score=102.53 TRINITY_DN3152_c0_g2_i1:106-1191(-)